jgi:catechol 2,3-dioxygenase-like lactoylglutathione lyase family enzyme
LFVSSEEVTPVFREPFPILHVEDVARSVRCYRESFGFELDYRWPDEGPIEFAFLKLGETGIGIATTAQPPLPDWPRGGLTILPPCPSTSGSATSRASGTSSSATTGRS